MLDFDDTGFRRGGAPHRIISGAVHYFRIHPDLWDDRLRRLRALGANTVDTYVPWNFHELPSGEYDFTGWRDLGRFTELARANGLDVILRPGPYICAEWEFGGFPARLLAVDGLRLRCADPAYLAEVDGWFDAVVPEILPLLASRGGPVVAVQVENEYGSYGNDAAYLAHLRDGLIARGVDCLLFTADGAEDTMQQGGTIPGHLATATFGSRPAERFEVLRRHQPKGPLTAMEFWIGWFDHLGEPHHVREAGESARALDDLLATGASVNLYMAHGGTNFGFWAGANHTGTQPEDAGHQPTVTSYDYDAPIGEAGELTAKFHAFRAVIGKYAPLPETELPEPLPRVTPQRIDRPTGRARLLAALDTLSAPLHRAAPEPMEKVGQSLGLIHYRTRVPGPRAALPLRIDGIGDRAHVFADGVPLGVLDRNAPDGTLSLETGPAGTTLDILVEALGRVNYGPLLENDRKGIGRGVSHGHQRLYDWEIRPLPLADLGGLAFSGTVGASDGDPVFHRFEATLDAPADAFVALPGWGRGLLWLNGFLLGRYSHQGPQRTLYAPAPLWRAGANELVLLELETHAEAVELRDRPDLGPTAAAPSVDY
ncbi:beta-galactosidase family protein [Streptomyces sp. CB01881]|uniref:glycoside hydrolase family 35 protein n=1 Tax=Streptomyces sp. CB01881 TaxID=2078691 RepID=UPI000CDC19D8|nr:beta-galactosidase family protein [Streptomyces sp. CB01881]AUY48448.1 beta-galactosidase [Streptomyces sp. CB01881]TYC76937.1 beta-galactosidase [Streptomyces sp. CB01881]